MDKKDYLLFPTLVRSVNNFLNKDECKNIFDTLLKLDCYDHDLLTGKSKTSHEHGNIFDIIDLKNLILNETNKFAESFGLITDNKFLNSWFNIQDKNSSLIPHTHPNSIISGVIYINVNEHSSPIHFYNPNPFISFVNKNNLKESSFDWFYIEPHIGMMLLFPSWLKHGFKDNKTEKRTVISFNIV
jgi:uncharacterized protein (TIGR02466 family)